MKRAAQIWAGDSERADRFSGLLVVSLSLLAGTAALYGLISFGQP